MTEETVVRYAQCGSDVRYLAGATGGVAPSGAAHFRGDPFGPGAVIMITATVGAAVVAHTV